MAGNFWLSSHCQQWLLTREELSSEMVSDLKYLTEDEYKKLHIFFASFIQTLGENLKLKQQIIATATVYFKRFYSRTSLKCVDPLLLAPTCIYVACKVEEYGPMSNTRFLNVCSSVCKNRFSFAYGAGDYPYRMNQILECEFFLLEVLDCCLIVFHPYRPLKRYVSDIGQEGNILQLAWKVCNDCLRCDVPLLYPPYIIALASIYMALVMDKRDVTQCFGDMNVDMDKILEVVKEILTLYDLWKTFDEKKETPELIKKMPKPKSTRPSSATPMLRQQHTPSPSLQ